MTGWQRLQSLPNCHFLGYRPYDELPAYMRASDVALVPYLRSEHTDSVYPLKLIEYLAAGLPVAATPLDAFRARPDLPVRLGATATEFAEAIARAGVETTERAERAATVASFSWDTMLCRMLELAVR